MPYNQYNLRSYKGQKLQNVGKQTAHSDSIIQAPDGCGLYDVWSGYEFGGTGSDFRKIFVYQFNWDIPAAPSAPLPARSSDRSNYPEAMAASLDGWRPFRSCPKFSMNALRPSPRFFWLCARLWLQEASP